MFKCTKTKVKTYLKHPLDEGREAPTPNFLGSQDSKASDLLEPHLPTE